MDILVPIVDCESKTSHKGVSNDVDVQLCLDSYLYPESLDGDNQYFCTICNKKCDATRSLLFDIIPPVLNIQLARYVFDRKTYAKRKLSTKVLLPRILYVPSNGNANKKRKCETSTNHDSNKAVYILCAVQNHLGNSALGGHYVADVMDWTTGVWYEFNDEDVKILEHGPVSSFEPSLLREKDRIKAQGGSDNTLDNNQGGTMCSDETRELKRKYRKICGSLDAYNLFYVEEGYLSQQFQSEMRRCRQHDQNSTCPNSTSNSGKDILACVESQRITRYQNETE